MAFGAFCNRSSRFYSVVLSAFGAFCIRGSPFKPLSTLLLFVGFEAVAPCKGNGISAQGIVNGVNDTLGPPHDWVLLHSRPVGAICRKWGNAPRHTRAYYRAKHTGVLSGETHGRIIGRNTRANYRAKHTVLPIYYISFSKRMPTPDLRPWDVGGGALPLFRRSAPTGRDTF